MDKTVPLGAAILLDFIGGIEAPLGYDTLYGNNHKLLAKPLTSRTLDEVIAAGPSWTTRFGSSACGRYQFMNKTLKDLKKELGLRGTQVFDPDLQDRLGYHLLKRRGYEQFISGDIGPVEFGKKLAQEWASLPVLEATEGSHRKVKRGQSFYAGDGLNKSLVNPQRVEVALALVLNAQKSVPVPPVTTPAPQPAPKPAPSQQSDARNGLIGWLIFLAVVIASGAAAVWTNFSHFIQGVLS